MERRRNVNGIIIGVLVLALIVASIGVHRQSIVASGLDSYLRINPSDQYGRMQALLLYSGWYGGKRNNAKLRSNTIEMIAYHPDDAHIVWQNLSLFLQDPSYLADITRLLELQKKTYVSDEGYYFVLAQCYAVASCPPLSRSYLLPKAFLLDINAPLDTKLRTAVDNRVAQKAIDAYKTAITCSKRHNNTPYANYCAESLGDFLYRLGRDRDCIPFLQANYPFDDSYYKPTMLLSYGCALYYLHRYHDALGVLRQVQMAGKSSTKDERPRLIMVADSTLGLIELDLGNCAEAEKYLLASAQTAAIDANWGRPIELAGRLLKLKRYDTVIQFCDCATKVAIANRAEIEDLLHRALSARETTISRTTRTRRGAGAGS